MNIIIIEIEHGKLEKYNNYVKHPHDPELYKAIAFNINEFDKLKSYIQEFFNRKLIT